MKSYFDWGSKQEVMKAVTPCENAGKTCMYSVVPDQTGPAEIIYLIMVNTICKAKLSYAKILKF